MLISPASFHVLPLSFPFTIFVEALLQCEHSSSLRFCTFRNFLHFFIMQIYCSLIIVLTQFLKPTLDSTFVTVMRNLKATVHLLVQKTKWRTFISVTIHSVCSVGTISSASYLYAKSTNYLILHVNAFKIHSYQSTQKLINENFTQYKCSEQSIFKRSICIF